MSMTLVESEEMAVVDGGNNVGSMSMAPVDFQETAHINKKISLVCAVGGVVGLVAGFFTVGAGWAAAGLVFGGVCAGHSLAAAIEESHWVRVTGPAQFDQGVSMDYSKFELHTEINSIP